LPTRPRRFSAGDFSNRPHLDGIHDFGADGNRADDDDRLEFMQPTLLRQIFQRRFNRVLWFDEIEFRDERRDAPA
jgi:hypothetical protein